MSNDTFFQCELSIANFTTVRFDLFMNLFMLQKMTFVCEFFTANFTIVRFNLFMDQLTRQDITFMCEILIAISATVW